MAEDLLKLLLTVADANKNQHETQEEMVKKLVNEMIINHLQSQTVSAAATANCYDIVQSFSKVMNYQIDHAITEKSELANEKAKRLQAEKETQDLRKQLEEIKLMKEDEGNKKEAERIRKDLNKLEVENSEVEETQEDMIKRVFNEAIANLQKTNSTSETSTSCNNDALLNEKLRQFDALAENVSGNSSKYMKAESNGNNGGKSYSDPAWFPGTSTRTSPYQDFPLNSNNIDCASNPFFGQANPNDKLKNTSKFTEDSCSHPSQPMNSFFNNKQFLDINQPIQGLYLVRNENFTQPPQQFPLQPSGGYNIPMDPNSFPQRNPQYMFNTNQSPFIPNFNQEPNQQNINQMNEAPGKKTRRKQSQPQEPKKNPTDGQQQPSDKNNTQKKKAAAKPQSNSESGEHTKNAGDSKSDETMKNSNATKPNINKTQEDMIKRVFNEAIANLQKTNSTSETSTSCNNDALLNEKLRQFDALAENVSGNSSKYMKAESNGNNGGKSYSDPAWFPGTSTRTSPYQDFPLNSNNIDCASNPFFGQANPNDKLKNTSKFTEDSCSHPSQPMNSFFNNKQFLDINQPIQGLYLVRNENFTQPPQQFPLQPSGGYNIPMDPNSFPQRNPQYMFNTNQSPFIPNFNQEPNQQNINQMNEAPGKKTRRKQSQPQEPKKNPTDGQQQPSDKNNTQKKKAAAKPQSNSESGEHTKNAGDSKSDETMKNSNATKPNINKTQEDVIKRVFNEAIANLQKTNSTSETSTSCNNDALLNEKLRQFDALAENVSGNSSKYMKAESNGNNGGKSYSDPAWFPGTSKSNDLNNTYNQLKDNYCYKDKFNFPVSPSVNHLTSPYQDFPLNTNNIDCASNPFFGQANSNDKLKNTSKFTEDSCSHPSQPMNPFFNNKQFLDINQPIQGFYLVRNENFTQPPQQFPLQPSGGYNIPMDPNSFPQGNPQYMFNTNQSPFIPYFNQEPNQQNTNQMNKAPGKKTRRKQSQPQEPKKNPTDGQQQPSDKHNTQKKKAAAKPQSNSESGEHTKNAGDSKSDETMKNSNATKPNINTKGDAQAKQKKTENVQKKPENIGSTSEKPSSGDAQTKQQKTENVQKKTENTASTSEKTSSGKGDTQTNKKKTENVPKKTENTGTTSEKLSSGKGDAQTNKKKTENTGSTSEKLSSESKGETPLNQKKPEIGQEKPDTAGSAEKEDSSDPNAAKKKKPRKKKSTGEKQKSDSAGSDNSKDNINIFIVNKFPTIMDVENGNLLFTQEVKDIIMVAKANNKKIVETPKIVKDMILFKMSYPEAKLIILD
ncbi:uncharacterized protein LOC142332080 isoform X2 [Lycorma delicatula]|uniref:uncharacterized protein LOC142332080 isoform X2 n=1 Tax=Lycorma delicatula TaxID=130591 RepID=UPI003F512744